MGEILTIDTQKPMSATLFEKSYVRASSPFLRNALK